MRWILYVLLGIGIISISFKFIDWYQKDKMMKIKSKLQFLHDKSGYLLIICGVIFLFYVTMRAEFLVGNYIVSAGIVLLGISLKAKDNDMKTGCALIALAIIFACGSNLIFFGNIIT